jgi:hypothetical protein
MMNRPFSRALLCFALIAQSHVLCAEELEELTANGSGQSRIFLQVGFPEPELDVSPIDESIVITNAAQLPEGYTSYRSNMIVSSNSRTGYHVSVRAPNRQHIAPDGSFRMSLQGNSGYNLSFEVVSDEAPDGTPTPVHHHGFGPPQGGTAHRNDSKVVNTNGRYDPARRDFTLHFFIFNGQFRFVPAGRYSCTLRLELIDT